LILELDSLAAYVKRGGHRRQKFVSEPCLNVCFALQPRNSPSAENLPKTPETPEKEFVPVLGIEQVIAPKAYALQSHNSIKRLRCFKLLMS
jgi:hypothetical protein